MSGLPSTSRPRERIMQVRGSFGSERGVPVPRPRDFFQLRRDASFSSVQLSARFGERGFDEVGREREGGESKFTELLVFVNGLLFTDLETFSLLRLELLLSNVISHVLVLDEFRQGERESGRCKVGHQDNKKWMEAVSSH
jgi:hypothetical protein